ncbi:histidine kinase [Nostoc linckia]|nr:histidine kinase [Nostoc linckia]
MGRRGDAGMRGCGDAGTRRRGDAENNQCPMPYAPCPMPYALCPHF